MASNIYNEGRVVGYSAYEIYVRHAMSEGMQPVSEKEWLLSTLTEGSSLLMRLTSTMLDRDGNALSTAGSHIVDIPLPTAPSRYEVTTREPSDWSAYFTRYYTRSGIAPNYTYTQITTEPIPTWAQNKYYTRIPPDTYQLQESQPANWATNWSYAYTRSGVAPNYIYTPATSWEPNKYYRTVVTHLIAANTIVASLFLGNGVYENGSYWASRVGNYGQLLGNTTPLSTSTYKNAEDVEPIGSYDFPTQATKMLLYANITDGIIITPGTWSPSSTTPPGNDFVPDLSDSAGQQVVRLYINNPITQTIQILLTGFLLKSTLEGMTDTTNGSINTLNPEDGDFLGPAVFPWANKIIFSTPNSFVDFIYNRKLIIDGVTPPTGTEVINKSIIDADTEGLSTYYGNGTAYNSAVHSILSSGKNASDDVPYEVLTVYSRKSVLPPALYVSQVDEAVERGVSAYPVDTVAPGTVKIFNSDGRLADAKDEASAVNQITGNVGMYRDADYIIHQTVPANASAPTDPISDVEVVQLQADRIGGQRPYAVKQTSGKKDSTSISLEDTSGNVLDRTGIHPPVFNGSRVYEKSQNNQLEPVGAQPADWDNSYNSYYWNTLIAWNGDGVTTSFSFPSAAIPSELKAVTVDDYISTYGIGWTYADGVVTFSTAPANLSIIQTFVSPPATFETINPNRSSNEKFLERKGTLHWDDLLFALANNKAIDLFDNDYFRYMMFNTLQPGFGIDISLIANNRISIINTLPNILISHMSEDSYTVRTYSLLHFDKASNTIKMKYAKSADNKYVYVRIDSMRYEISGGATEWLSNTNLSDSNGFAFVHADTSQSSRRHSIICGIEFNTNGELYRVLHNPPQSKHYEFRDTSDYSTGIWNVQPTTARASWSAHCELRANSSEGYRGDIWASTDAYLDQVGTIILPEGQGWDLVVAGLSYIDGYNKQFTDTGAYPVSLGSLASNHINLSVSGVFELVDD